MSGQYRKVLSGGGQEKAIASYSQYTPDLRNVAIFRRRGYSSLKILRRARGLTLEALSELTGISPSYLSRLEGGARRLNTDLLRKLSTVLECQPGDLLAGNGESAGAGSVKGIAGFMTRDEEAGNASKAGSGGVRKDLPVYALSTGLNMLDKDAKIKLDLNNPIDWLQRPPQLIDVQKGFGLYVGDNGYAPKYMCGDTLFVNPSRPLSLGCSVLVLMKEACPLLRQFRGWEEDAVYLSAFTDPQDARGEPMEKSNVECIYKIVGTVEQ